MRRWSAGAAAIGMALTAAACSNFGYTNRVLHRVPSPDGKLVAVCQEIPVFDGPDFDIRLERPDGTMVQRVMRSGDGDPCHEIAWSPDGRTIAVLSSHVARVRFVDVEKALGEGASRRMYWPEVSLGREGNFTWGHHVRFTTASDVEVSTCPYSLSERRQTGAYRCLAPEQPRRFRAPACLAGRC